MFKTLMNSVRRIVYVRISSERVSMQSNDGLYWEADPCVGVKTEGTTKIISVIKDGTSYKNFEGVSFWVNPFEHPRSIIADFTVGEQLLNHGLRTMLQSLGGFLMTVPALVILHPLEKTEGGLTEVEKRALKELGLGVGFRECLVYTGPALVILGMTMKNAESQLGLR